ncbi:acylphosphatase [Mesorhizobium sp. 1B3]|uniref:acylphosphatase n=1 Tax=Mesorhizobium sp. 1B3 TaxID=3243599 RepID=UPI003D957C77
MTSAADGRGKTVLARITGRVQGVSFRVWTRNEATQLGLVGWVRNEEDGSVTALLSGPESVILRMIARLRQGPSGATVTGVSFTETKPDGSTDFRIVV